MSTCRPDDMIPADLIHANTSLYPYILLYIQYYIYDKPCMRGRSVCWQLDMYKHIHVYLPTCRLAVLLPANLSVYPYRSLYIQSYILAEKHGFWIFKTNAADRLCGNCTDEQRRCFRYTYSTILLLP